MKSNTGFLKTKHDRERGRMLNNHPKKIIRDTGVEISGNNYNRTPCLQKVFTDKTYETAKSMNDQVKAVFRDFLLKTDDYIRITSKGRM